MQIDSFSITFEIITDESARNGDADSRGWCIEPQQGYSLREAVAWINMHKGAQTPFQADTSPLSVANAPTTFNYDNGEDFRTGDHEYLALHIPTCVTASSRMRIARLLGYGKHWR